jgi:uncharacterized protein (TIGR03118 family)
MHSRHVVSIRSVLVTSGLAVIGLAGSLSAATLYVQTNLTSDISGLAANTDPNLKNPWGMSFSATSPFWVSDQVTNVSTLYNGAGTPQALIVGTPPSPTGQVFNASTSFNLQSGGQALFIFDSLSGTISGWNAAQGTTAATMFTATDGAAFTGLANASNSSGNFLYAADFANGRIDVFNGNFGLTTLAGHFTDPNLPAGYSPYNIQTVGGKLYVEYDAVDPVTHRPATTANTGVVDVFDTNGNFLQRLVTNTHLNSPWGITQAPGTFGSFGGDILVGNFGDGTISAFDPTSGAFLGTLSNSSGNPIVNSGLWALDFRAPGSGFDSNALFFTAGINGEADGLFGEITPAPEPSTLVLLGLGLASVGLLGHKTRIRRS